MEKIVEKPVKVVEIKEVEVERIVYQKEIQYVDKIVEKPVERIVY